MDTEPTNTKWVSNFAQIGNDKPVTNFFERIDNEIKGEHGLRRDECPEPTIFSILLHQSSDFRLFVGVSSHPFSLV